MNSEGFFFSTDLVFLIPLSILFPLTGNSNLSFLDVSIRLGGYDLDRVLRRVYSLYYGKIRYPFFLPDLPPLLPFHFHSALSTRSKCLYRIAELNTVIFTMVKISSESKFFRFFVFLSLSLRKRIKHIYYEKNIKRIRLNNKLDYTKLGLYRIKKIWKLINYKLDLSKKIRIYLSFYILILKLINPETPV